MSRLFTVCIILSALLLGACGASQTAVSTADSAASVQAEVVSEAAVPTESEVVVAEDVSATSEPALVEPAPEESADKQEPENVASSSVPEENASDNEEIPAEFFRCELKVEVDSSVYTARSFGPSLEEGRDNSVDEACAIPCAEKLADAQLSDDEAAARIDECTENCSENARVLAAACWQNHKLVYTEGEWNENGDAAPTNGAEILDTQQVTE